MGSNTPRAAGLTVRADGQPQAPAAVVAAAARCAAFSALNAELPCTLPGPSPEGKLVLGS